MSVPRLLVASVGVLLATSCGVQHAANSTTSSEPTVPASTTTSVSVPPTPTPTMDSAPAGYATVVDELVDLAGDGQPLLLVADLASTILYDSGFPAAGAWWGRLGFILGEGLDRERYQFRTPVSIQHGSAVGSMEICIGDECHEMVLSDEDRQAAVDGTVMEQLVAEVPEGFLLNGWCSPDTMFAYGHMPDQGPLPIPGQSNLRVVDGPVSLPAFAVDLDRHAIDDAELPAGWSVACGTMT